MHSSGDFLAEVWFGLDVVVVIFEFPINRFIVDASLADAFG